MDFWPLPWKPELMVTGRTVYQVGNAGLILLVEMCVLARSVSASRLTGGLCGVESRLMSTEEK